MHPKSNIDAMVTARDAKNLTLYVRLRNEVISDNMGFIYHTVNKIGKRHLDRCVDDLVASAVIGVMRACETYDPAKGAFTTHAYYWIWQSVGREIRNTLEVVHAPLLKPPVAVMSLDVVDDDRNDARAISNKRRMLKDKRPGPDKLYENESVRRTLSRKIAELPLRSQTIIRLRFGLDGGEERTLREIGVEVGLTRERVRQIIEEVFHSWRYRLRDLR